MHVAASFQIPDYYLHSFHSSFVMHISVSMSVASVAATQRRGKRPAASEGRAPRANSVMPTADQCAV